MTYLILISSILISPIILIISSIPSSIISSIVIICPIIISSVLKIIIITSISPAINNNNKTKFRNNLFIYLFIYPANVIIII